jgi:uncharacterized protein YdaU (DUF1376 family)
VTLPEPMTPPDCDLRGLEYMPLLGQRLFGSDFNGTASDSEWRAALTLWWAAWTQCPAGSLPDDDAALCRLADLGRDVKTWLKLKDKALHGFVMCSDGRLYHPTLAEQAVIAWDKRQQDRVARTADTQRKAKERAARSELFKHLEAVGVTPDWNTKTKDLRDLVTQYSAGQSDSSHAPVTPPVTRTVTAKTGRDGTEEERRSSVANATGVSPPILEDPSKVLFDAGVALLVKAGSSEKQARGLIARWRKAKGEPWVREALVSAEGKAEPVSWIEARIASAASIEDEARAVSRATAERYRRMAIPGPPATARLGETAVA